MKEKVLQQTTAARTKECVQGTGHSVRPHHGKASTFRLPHKSKKLFHLMNDNIGKTVCALIAPGYACEDMCKFYETKARNLTPEPNLTSESTHVFFFKKKLFLVQDVCSHLCIHTRQRRTSNVLLCHSRILLRWNFSLNRS